MRWRRRTIYTWPIDFVTNLLEFDELAYLLQRIWLNSMCSQVQNEFWRSLCAGNLLWTLALTRSINWGLYGTKIRSAQHRGIVRTIRCCLASVSATMKRGGDHVQSLDLFPKALLFFNARYIHPFLKPQEFPWIPKTVPLSLWNLRRIAPWCELLRG